MEIILYQKIKKYKKYVDKKVINKILVEENVEKLEDLKWNKSSLDFAIDCLHQAYLKSEWGQDKPSVDKQNSPSVDKQNSPSVDKQNSPSVDKQNSPSVDNQNSPSVDKQNSPSVDKQNSPSVDKQNSPSVDKQNNTSTDIVYLKQDNNALIEKTTLELNNDSMDSIVSIESSEDIDIMEDSKPENKETPRNNFFQNPMIRMNIARNYLELIPVIRVLLKIFLTKIYQL